MLTLLFFLIDFTDIKKGGWIYGQSRAGTGTMLVVRLLWRVLSREMVGCKRKIFVETN